MKSFDDDLTTIKKPAMAPGHCKQSLGERKVPAYLPQARGATPAKHQAVVFSGQPDFRVPEKLFAWETTQRDGYGGKLKL